MKEVQDAAQLRRNRTAEPDARQSGDQHQHRGLVSRHRRQRNPRPWFGDEFRDYPELVGRQIVLHGNEGPEAYTVAGVFADLPKKRSLDFDAAIRFENRTKYGMASYWGATASTYVTLHPLAKRKVAPEQPFEYEFLDRAFARQYENDKESSRTVTFASVVAILIACMGLFGHATIVLQRRTKEIGVRKVLGATVAEILALLLRDLTKMVALACLLAFPLAHFLVGQWLSRYAYQFGLGVTTYLLCGTIAFAIALGTVAYIGVRAARENPVHALRYE